MYRTILFVFILFLHTFAFADDFNGYRDTTWGMSRSEVIDVLKKQGLKYSSGVKTITVEDNLFGKKATITYHVGFLNPLKEVDIYLYSDRGDLPAREITNSLVEKYGRSGDMVCGDITAQFGGSFYHCSVHWLVGKTSIRYSADTTIIDIQYTFSNEADDKKKDIKNKI